MIFHRFDASYRRMVDLGCHANLLITSATPWIFPIDGLVCCHIRRKLFYRLFGIGLMKKWFKNTFVASLIPTIIWALGHVTYPIFPSTTRLLRTDDYRAHLQLHVSALRIYHCRVRPCRLRQHHDGDFPDVHGHSSAISSGHRLHSAADSHCMVIRWFSRDREGATAQ